MEDIKNENIETTADEVIVESEEVLEVALAEEAAAEENAVSNSDNSFEYTDGELSGLTDKQKRRREIFDKITTGILIALLASPLAIVIYIFLWFILR